MYSERGTQKCVVTYRSSADRAPDPSLPREPTPLFIPPPQLGKDFRATGNVSHFQPKDNPDGFDRADPDIVWRGFVPIKTGTKTIVPRGVELWSHHYGLPVGLHPKYSRYSGMPYDDTFTAIDREKLERYHRKLDYYNSEQYQADWRATCKAHGLTFFPRTPSPPPGPEATSGHSPLVSNTTLPSVELQPRASSSSHARTPDQPPRSTSERVLDLPGSSASRLGETLGGTASDDTSTAPSDTRKRKLDNASIHDQRSPKRHSSRAASGPRARTRSARARPQGSSPATRASRSRSTRKTGLEVLSAPRRSARLADKPAVRYKY